MTRVDPAQPKSTSDQRLIRAPWQQNGSPVHDFNGARHGSHGRSGSVRLIFRKSVTGS